MTRKIIKIKKKNKQQQSTISSKLPILSVIIICKDRSNTAALLPEKVFTEKKNIIIKSTHSSRRSESKNIRTETSNRSVRFTHKKR